MNPVKGEWWDKSWNPCSGCRRRCPFCYARLIAEGRLRGRYGYPEQDPFKPTFHEDKLLEPSRATKPLKIFTVSMGDLFDSEMERPWIWKIMSVIWNCGPGSKLPKHPNHIFIVLTKVPDNIDNLFPLGYSFPPNLWLGVSVTTEEDLGRIETLRNLRFGGNYKRIVSFEPLHGPIEPNLSGIDWVIIGAETGRRKDKVAPKPEWVWGVLNEAYMLDIPVWMKNNLRPFVPVHWPWKQEHPM